jgi:DNA-binding beta-propeller fold protein YncE
VRQWKFTIAFVICVLMIPAPSAAGSSGTWESAWGKDVVDGGGTGFEICTVALACKKGEDTSWFGGELSSPENPAADAAGNVYVADRVNDRVQKFDSQGNFLRAWGRNVVIDGGVGGVCTDDQADNLPPSPCFEICTVAASCAEGGVFTDGFGGEFDVANAVAVDGAGNVYVADLHRVQKFDSQGTFLRAWGKDVGGVGVNLCTVAANCEEGVAGSSEGELDNPDAIAADAAGNVYVADTGNDRIQKFDSQGNFLDAWGSAGNLGGQFSFPQGVAADGAGNVYVADSASNRIQKFDSQGNFLLAWGKDVVTGGVTGFEICTVAANCKSGSDTTALGGELDSPEGIAAEAGSVYVTDTFNERVQKFDAAGNFASAWGRNVDVAGTTVGEICTIAANCQEGQVGTKGGELDNPEGVAVDPAGNVYVADSDNDRIQKYIGDPVTAPPVVIPPGGNPELDVGAKAKQKLQKLAVNVGCGADPCDVKATGKIKLKQGKRKKSFSLKAASADVAAGATEKLRLKLAKKQAKAATKLLDDGAKGKATVKVEAVVRGVKLTESVRIALKG